MILKLSKILIAVLFAVMFYPAMAADNGLNYPVTSMSAHYFTIDQLESAVDSLTEAQFYHAGVPGEVFRERYSRFKDDFISRLAPRLKKEFTEYESSELPDPSKRTYDLMRSDYIDHISWAIRDVLNSGDNRFKDYLDYKSLTRIVHFDSHVKLLKSGEVQVTESIKVFKPINRDIGLYPIIHGIIRNFLPSIMVRWDSFTRPHGM